MEIDDLNFKVKETVSYEEMKLHDLEQLAESKGMKIIFPEDDELFIDIDSIEGLVQFNKQLEVLKSNYGSDISAKITESKSGMPHCHIIVKLPWNVNQSERIALQAILGSDPLHELLCLMNHIKGYEKAVLFFEPIEEN